MKKLFALLICSTFFTIPAARASFEENARRYLSAQELIQTLSLFFNVTYSGMPTTCTGINEGNSSVTGVNSPKSGEPVAPVPGQGTVVWMVGCIAQSLTPELIVQNPQTLGHLIGENLLHEFQAGEGLPKALQTPWTMLGEDKKNLLIANMTSALLGSDVIISDFGFILNPDAFRLNLRKLCDARANASILDNILFLSVNLAIRDEFLSY